MNCVAKVRSHKALCGFANSACAKPGSHLRRTQVVPQLWQIWPPSGNFMTFLEILLISMPWDQRCVQLRCQGCQRIHPRTADATLRAFVQNHSIFICLRLLDECAQALPEFHCLPSAAFFIRKWPIYTVCRTNPLAWKHVHAAKGRLEHTFPQRSRFVREIVSAPCTGSNNWGISSYASDKSPPYSRSLVSLSEQVFDVFCIFNFNMFNCRISVRWPVQ